MNEQEFTQELDVTLDDRELDRLRDELAAVVGDHKELEGRKRAQVAEMNRELKGLVGRIESLAQEIRERTARKLVRCRRVFDPERLKVGTLRLDGPAPRVIDVRDMTPAEVEELRREEQFQLDHQVAVAMADFERQMRESASEVAVSTEEVGPPGFDLTSIPGVSAAIAEAMVDAGFGTLEALHGAIPTDLMHIRGIGEKKAEAILLYVAENYPLDDDDDADADDDLPDALR